MSLLRVAIVGAGLMGRWHAHAARRAGARVAAIVDADAGRASRLAAGYTGSLATGSLTAVLDRVDVVHICTPTPTHVPLAQQAIDAVRHVLVEKPFADSPGDTDRLLAHAQARSVLACPVHQFLFQRGVQQALDPRIGIGPLRHIDLMVCSAGADRGDDAARDRIAAEVLPHLVSLLVRLFPGCVARMPWTVVHPAPGEMRAITYAGAVTIGLMVSMGGRPTRNRMQLIGERGSVHADLFHGFAVVHRGRVSRVRKIAQPFVGGATEVLAAAGNIARRAWNREPAYPGLRRLCELFYAAVDGRKPPPIAAEETMEVARTCERLTQLARAAAHSTESR